MRCIVATGKARLASAESPPRSRRERLRTRKTGESEMDSKLSRSGPRSGRGQGAVVGWLDERFPLVQSVDAELYRRVPNYASAFYRYLGGLALIILFILAFRLTGSVLPWDLNSYFARGRELSILSGASVLPAGVSEFLKNLLQGGPIIGPATLLRFYIAHVFLLPAVIAGLMYVHFRLVRRQGPAEPS